MNEDKRQFEDALNEWRLKHGIRDDDSVLQMLELLKLFFQNVKIELPDDPDTVKLLNVRTSLQALTQQAKEFSRDARELTVEIRKVPNITEQLSAGRGIAFVCVALSALVAGIIIGRFLL